jgi:hypothetical protein
MKSLVILDPTSRSSEGKEQNDATDQHCGPQEDQANYRDGFHCPIVADTSSPFAPAAGEPAKEEFICGPWQNPHAIELFQAARHAE